MNNIISKHLGLIRNGKFIPSETSRFEAFINGLEGKEVMATFVDAKEKNTRSTRQNRYYHGVVCKILSDELGYSPSEIHEILKYKFLSEPIAFFREVRGERKEIFIRKPISTRILNTAEFEHLMAKIRSWASIDLSINIPEPNEVI